MFLFAYSFLVIVIQAAQSMPTQNVEMNICAGKRVAIKCDLGNPEGNVIIWKHKKRVLFAGEMRVRHDDKISVTEYKLGIDNVKVSDNRNIYMRNSEE